MQTSLTLKYILVFVVIALAIPAEAKTFVSHRHHATAESATTSRNDPIVTIRTPGSNIAKHIALFPFELPGYALKIGMAPVGVILSLTQRARLLDRMESALSNKDKTLWVYPILDKNPGSSFGGGVGVKAINLWKQGYRFDINYRIHVNADMFAALTVGKDGIFHISKTPADILVDASWAWQHSFNYYGVGNNSTDIVKATYNEQDVDGVVRLGVEPIKALKLYALLGISASIADNATILIPDPVVDFPDAYNHWLPYIRFGFGLSHDTRDSVTIPHRGGVQRLEYSRYQYIGGSEKFSYGEYHLLLQHNIPLWSDDNVLLLRTEWRFQQLTAGNSVPFQRMVMLDADHWLRGFDRGRFRDRASCVFNGEYYFPLYRGMRGVIFGDTGRVFPGLANFSFSSFKYSAGAGIDLQPSRVLLARFRIAYGGEGVKFSLSFLRR